MQPTLILASSSPYRKLLLDKLRLSFSCQAPNIDETPAANETPAQLVYRLATQKARAIAQTTLSDAIIIASDQVAVLDGTAIGKPHNTHNAIQQLSLFIGKKVTFLTSLCVFNNQLQTYDTLITEFHVYLRDLAAEEIARYIELEQPFDCAGSFKCEGLGISLFEKMEGDDPNSLIGLPLIQLCTLLRKNGINPLQSH